ncbi:MAG: hypothetical protein ACI90V_003762 [Bacillariaceae sp.]|jgi:hypothetical protein
MFTNNIQIRGARERKREKEEINIDEKLSANIIYDSTKMIDSIDTY